MSDSQRVVKMCLSLNVVEQLLKSTGDLPGDLSLIAVRTDFWNSSVEFAVRSSAFQKIPEGGTPPVFVPEPRGE